MKVVRILSVMVVALMVVTAAFAKETKIGYVDLSRLFDNYQKTKEFDKQLQGQGEAFTKERDGMIAKIRDAQGKLALLKEDEKNKLSDSIEKQKTDLIEYDKQKRTDLAKQRDEKVRGILLEIEKIVSEMAKKEGYDYILNDRVLVYGDQTQNITDKVLKILNDSYKK